MNITRNGHLDHSERRAKHWLRAVWRPNFTAAVRRLGDAKQTGGDQGSTTAFPRTQPHLRCGKWLSGLLHLSASLSPPERRGFRPPKWPSTCSNPEIRIVHARCQNSRAPIGIRFTISGWTRGGILYSETLEKEEKTKIRLNQSRHHVY